MILALRTDQPEAELQLLNGDGEERAQHIWLAHRTLASTLVDTIEEFLKQQGTKSDELTGLIVFTGSGSFTGLRIGTTVANAMAYAHGIPVVDGEGDDWLARGVEALKSTKPGTYVIPRYDKEPNITKPKN